PYDIEFTFVPHTTSGEQRSRDEESAAISKQLRAQDHVILLDERGEPCTSPQLANRLQQLFDTSHRDVFGMCGGYGVNYTSRARAYTLWPLAKLVVPHQLMRLMIVEQIYRAQEISAGRPYNHL